MKFKFYHLALLAAFPVSLAFASDVSNPSNPANPNYPSNQANPNYPSNPTNPNYPGNPSNASAPAPANPNNPAMNPAMNNGSQAQSTQNQDSGILAWLIVLNKNEIAASNMALKEKVNESIKKYAIHLKKDHSRNLEETMKLSRRIKEKPVETAEATDLQKKGKEMLEALKPLDKQQFQTSFIDDMVAGHDAALRTIDQNLNVVSNADLKDFLQKTRTRIMEHLAEAKEIQEKLKSST